MAKTPEARVKDSIRLVLDAIGATYGMPIGSAYGRSNLCDFIVCLPGGMYMEIEAKARPHSAVRPNQKQKLTAVRDVGGVALIVHSENFDELHAAIAEATGMTVVEVFDAVFQYQQAKAQQKKARRTERKVIYMKEE